jgi:hypothetical protein
MIKLQDLTPAVYYNQSRDFQFIGRLYDVVLNSVKTNAANLYNLPIGQNMDEQLLNLLAMTLGFKATKQYNSKQLLAICHALPTILKHKGSIQALVLAVNALLTAEGVNQALDYTLLPKQGITLYVAQELADLTLLTDLLDYLLPAGLSCMIVKESQAINKVETKVEFTSNVKINGLSNEDRADSNKDWVFDGILSRELSILTDVSPNFTEGGKTTEFTELALGEVGLKPSITSNTTIVVPLVKEVTTETTISSEGEAEQNE